MIIILVMPIYEYRCTDGHTFEVVRGMTDDPVTECEVCGKPVERVFHPIAVHFKGSGFYTTDYARKGSKSSESGSKDSGSKNGSDSKSGDSKSGDSKSADSKSADSKSSDSQSSKSEKSSSSD